MMTNRIDWYTIDDLRYTASKLDGSHQKAIRQQFQRNDVNTATYMELMSYFQDHKIRLRRAPRLKRNAG